MKRTLSTLLAIALVIAMALPVFAVTDLTTAAVTKIDTPTSGNKLDYTATVGSDQYKLLNKNNDTFKNGITWYDCTAGEYVKTTHIAVAGHVYMVEVHLVPASGCTFSASATGSVNGHDIGEVAGGGEEIALIYEFPACPYPSPVAFTSKSLFEVSGEATVDLLKTSANVMDRGDITADMYNAALEKNMKVSWVCSGSSALDKKGESVVWTDEDLGEEFICRVGFYNDDACTEFVDYFDSQPFTVKKAPVATVKEAGDYNLTLGETFKLQLTSSISGVTFEPLQTSLPDGLTLSTKGLISGTPKKEGHWHVTVAVFRNDVIIGDGGFDFDVTAKSTVVPEITTKTLPEATVGQPYSVKLSCTDPDAAFGEYYNPGKANDLGKTGLILTQHGELEGTPEKEGSYTFWIQAVGEGGEDYKAYTLTVKAADPQPTESTEQPADPTEQPAESTEQPADPTEQPTDPTEQPADPAKTDEPKTDKPADTAPTVDGGKDGDSSILLFVGMGLGVLVAGVAVAIVLLLKKKFPGKS